MYRDETPPMGRPPADRFPLGQTPTNPRETSLLAAKLVKLRRRRDLSQQQVADALGVSRQTISNWEGAQGAPALDKAMELARLYGVNLNDLASDDVLVMTSGCGTGGKDLHVLELLVGCVCRIDCDNDDWTLSGAGASEVRVLDLGGGWLKVAYEQRDAATLQKKRVVQLLDVADITAAVILAEPDADDGKGEDGKGEVL